jgi:hypothetical protein
MSGQILEDTGAVRYVENSYTSVGNDGAHFNQSILEGSNSSVPSAVLGALYEMSDHLPVTADIRIERLPEPIDTIPSGMRSKAHGPRWSVSLQSSEVLIQGLNPGDEVQLIDLAGQACSSMQSDLNGTCRISSAFWSPGVYILMVRNANGESHSKKIVLF